MDEVCTTDHLPTVIEINGATANAQQWWASLTQTERDLHMVKLRNAELVRERGVLLAEREILRGLLYKLVALCEVASGVDNKSLYAAPIVVEARTTLRESTTKK